MPSNDTLLVVLILILPPLLKLPTTAVLDTVLSFLLLR
ncbi:hypothetical protein [uncultured Gammaproteobacteria bacterium]|nr:hypothetical protein [uncultured Gammaproteobacteria bacterium]